VTEEAFDGVKAAPIRVTLPDIPTPTTRSLSNYYYPTPATSWRRRAAAVRSSVGRHRANCQDARRAG
jgi:pyruvate/2-oxoglutarate/acetoin dehydrogenase E1 component